jgi:steroid delta-isomerase-like uncharacterized protein
MGDYRMTTKLALPVMVMILASVLVTGCCQECSVKDVEEQNKATVVRIHAEVSRGNMAIFDEVLTPNYVRHCQAMPPGLQELEGTEEFKAFIAEYLAAVPDNKDTIELMLAEDDKVAYVTKMTGTQTGPMGDLPASGKSFEVVNIIIHRFEDGKIAETWVSWDNVAMLAQLGFFPPPLPEQP